jgi:tRNA (cytidine32/uridine32-2'-O)-methyltransferase
VSGNKVNGLLDRIVVVLMRTTHSGNIGAVARACKTMGITKLRLVNPVADINQEAMQRASGADDVLRAAQVFETLEGALADSILVLGASARSRKMTWPVGHPRDLAELAVKELLSPALASEAKVVLLFGQEASGLSNEELQRCNYHACIPANPEYSSLNLAMAVQVMAYEVRMAALLSCDTSAVQISAVLSPEDDGWDDSLASGAQVDGLLSHIEETLIGVDYFDPNNPGTLMSRIKRLLLRSKLDKMEVNILRGVCKAVLSKASK